MFEGSYVARLSRYGYERRDEKRRIKHLNWGKTLTLQGDFLSECLIANLTSKGACLRIVRPIQIPRFFLLYIDFSSHIFEGETIWRHGAQLGCKLVESSHASDSIVARRMCAKFYAL